MQIVHGRHARSAFPFPPRRREHRGISIHAGRPARKEKAMGQPVVHFEVIGKDGATLQRYYSQLFGWEVDADNPNSYGAVSREGNTNADGAGIAGGIAAFPDYAGHVTFYVEVPDIEASLATAESLGGTRVFGPDMVPGTDIELGQFTDPEGHLIGLIRAAS
jgi:predicted enzyme related to lactoylglutathione lyase